jgi:hypothetical protein
LWGVSLKPLHKLSGSIIYAFLILHLANHFLGLMGTDTHIAVMGVMRLIYRHPIVECALFLAFVVQAITGVALVRKAWAEKQDFIHQLYALSGLLILAFVLIHVGQMVYGRFIERTDTNIFYIAAGFVGDTSRLIQTVIYAVGLMGLFLHFACAAYSMFKKENQSAGYAVMGLVLLIGAICTWYLVAMLRGDLFPLNIPEEYSQSVASEPLSGQ